MPDLVTLADHATPTQRALMVLMQDVRRLKKAEQRVRRQLEALAAQHGIEMPED